MSHSSSVDSRVDAFLQQLANMPSATPPSAGDQWLRIHLRLDEERRRRALAPLRWARLVAVTASLVLAGAVLWSSPGLHSLLAPLARLSQAGDGVWAVLSSARVLISAALVLAAVVVWFEGENWIEA